MLTSSLAWAVYALWIVSVLAVAIGWRVMRRAAIAARRRQIAAELRAEPPPEIEGYSSAT
jgi:hypothetical protein